jgi:hypothetical protein
MNRPGRWSFYIFEKAKGLTYVSPGQRPADGLGKNPANHQIPEGAP